LFPSLRNPGSWTAFCAISGAITVRPAIPLNPARLPALPHFLCNESHVDPGVPISIRIFVGSKCLRPRRRLCPSWREDPVGRLGDRDSRRIAASVARKLPVPSRQFADGPHPSPEFADFSAKSPVFPLCALIECPIGRRLPKCQDQSLQCLFGALFGVEADDIGEIPTRFRHACCSRQIAFRFPDVRFDLRIRMATPHARSSLRDQRLPRCERAICGTARTLAASRQRCPLEIPDPRVPGAPSLPVRLEDFRHATRSADHNRFLRVQFRWPWIRTK